MAAGTSPQRDVMLEGRAGRAGAEVDLVVAHQVQPTSERAPLTMAWVVDLDLGASEAGGADDGAAAVLRRYEEAVLEVMVEAGLSLDEAMEPPRLPSPFLYRPFEAGARRDGRALAQLDLAEATQEAAAGEAEAAAARGAELSHLMLATCSGCGASHWLPALEVPAPAARPGVDAGVLDAQPPQEPPPPAAAAPAVAGGAPRRAPTMQLSLRFAARLHAAGCAHRARDFQLHPSLRKVGPGYRPPPQGGPLERMTEAVIEVSEAQPFGD